MIEWLIQTRADLPLPQAFLAAEELDRLAALRSAKRRDDWLLGRWTAKRLIQDHIARHHNLNLHLHQIAIQSDPDGAPRITCALLPLYATLSALTLSISHSADRAFCALGLGVPVGVDIERIEPRDPSFAADYFTPVELALLETAPPTRRDLFTTTIWSAKEAVLKLLRHGLTVDTRQVECLPQQPNGRIWTPLALSSRLAAGPMSGWWRADQGFVFTIATDTVAV